MTNRYEQLKDEAITDCKEGRYADAERKLLELIEVLRQNGAPLQNSPTMYWYLVARHQGDTNAAMNEFLKM